MAGFSLYMPPCMPVFAGDNGGATSQGVSRDKILIVRYVSQLPPGLAQLLQALGVDEDDAKKQEMDDALIAFYNNHAETYGRQVVMVTKHASGTDDRQEAMTRDANEIAAMKPFAVYHTQPGAPDPVFARTLASKGIICVCATSRSRSLYRQTRGYVWSTQPILEEIYDATAEYAGTRLAGKPPAFAGALPQDMREAKRRFGLIWVSGSQQTKDPGLKEGKDHYKRQLARYGVELAAEHEVTFDVPLMQTQAVGAIAAMKAAKVTNLMCACDPFSPIFLTREATRADYYPEWLINPLGFGDLTFFGRTRDQNQWRHAFGISAFPVPPATVASTSAARAFTHMRPGATPGQTMMAREWAIQLLFNGIHLAGPRLMPQTFAEGMYRYPRTGGQAVHPLMYYTPDSPARVKDFAEIFWSADDSGQDETGREGRGIVIRVDGGRRYQPGQWGAFNSPRRTGAVFTSDTPPESLPHDADGHRHPPSQRCRSCR